jgi:hypothetical protein
MTIEECWAGCQVDLGGEKQVTIKCLECIFLVILQNVVRLAGIVTFLFLIVGGFKYLTSGGDPKATQSAKNTITYTVLGLVLLVLAWFILKFLEDFLGLQLTEFVIPTN